MCIANQWTGFYNRDLLTERVKVNNGKTAATPQMCHSDIFMVKFAEISHVCVCVSSLLTLILLYSFNNRFSHHTQKLVI